MSETEDMTAADVAATVAALHGVTMALMLDPSTAKNLAWRKRIRTAAWAACVVNDERGVTRSDAGRAIGRDVSFAGYVLRTAASKPEVLALAERGRQAIAAGKIMRNGEKITALYRSRSKPRADDRQLYEYIPDPAEIARRRAMHVHRW